jgi:prepilin-type processing-associated H-X9-DG protein
VAVTLTHLSVNQKAYKFKLPQAPEMLLASVGRQVVLATDSQSFKAATATISGAQSGVAKSETYQETMANLEGSNLLTVYGNLAPVQGLGYLVQAMGAEQIQPIYGTFAKALVDLEAFGVGVGFDGEAAQATMFLRAKPGSGAEVLPVMAASAAFGAALLFPAFSTHRQIPQQQDCYDNISCVVKSTLLYASDFNKLPSRTNWRAQITDYVSDSGQFLCADGAAIIAFNKNLGGLDLSKIKNPSEVVMFFEARPGLPYASGSRVDALLPHDGKGWFAYADGHVEQLSAAPSQYHWVPKYAQSKPAPKKAKK